MDWIHEGTPQPFSAVKYAETWMDDGSVRRIKQIGPDSTWITPGTFVFTDNNNPWAQALCDMSRVRAWRPVDASAV
jgi:hypothetical protein